MDIGSAVGRQNGVTEAQIRELDRYQQSDAFTELERAVLDYATAMTSTPVEVADDTFAVLRAAFDDAQLVELTTAIAWENFRSRFNHALGVPADNYSEAAACAVPVRRSPTRSTAGQP